MNQNLTWQRFTLAESMTRYAIYLIAITLLVFAFKTVEINYEFVADAPHQIVDLFERMTPLDWGYFPQDVDDALIETLHIATLGTLFTLFIAIPVGILGARNITPYASINWLAKLIMVTSRTVNSLVWAIIFVAILGPGPIAGTAAIACRSIGFIAKMFADALEEIQPGQIEAIQATGAPWPSVFLKAIWPQIKPAFWSITLFRWDINVRESAVLGYVGAGGIGMILNSAIDQFAWDRVGVILLTILTVVMLAEVVVTAVRKRII